MNTNNVDAEKEIFLRCRELADSGLPIGDVIKYLHERGVTITESMKALIVVYNISLREAKSLVAEHPVWSEVVRASEPLQENAERAIRELEKQQKG